MVLACNDVVVLRPPCFSLTREASLHEDGWITFKMDALRVGVHFDFFVCFSVLFIEINKFRTSL